MPAQDRCAFCPSPRRSEWCAIVYADERVMSFVNPGQHENGSLLVIPVEHFANILDLPDELIREIYGHVRAVSAAVVRAFGATGVNVFQNNGVAAGQTVPHYHVHVVPRYSGSDPFRVFDRKDQVLIDFEQCQKIAAAVRAALP